MSILNEILKEEKAKEEEPKAFELNGVKLEIQPFTIPELKGIMRDITKKAPELKTPKELSAQIMHAVLKKSVPDVTIQECRLLSQEQTKAILKEIVKVNELLDGFVF